jgi:putative sigma-54 modulation protein
MDRNMNRQNNHELIVSGIHLDLTPSLKTYVREKTERLFRHEERILRIRVELECDSKEAVGSRFKAKGHMVINGPELNAIVSSDECHKAISLLTDKLDRMLRRRARLQKEKRNHPHNIEFADVALPKAV